MTGPRRRGPVIQRRVRSPGVVFLPPLLHHDLGLLQRVEDLPVQAFIPQLPIETLTIPVLPWTTWFDVQPSGPEIPQPWAQLPGDELRAVIGSNVLRDPSPQHHLRQRLDHLQAAHPSLHSDRQAFPRILVQQRQQPQRPSIVGSGANKVIAPDVVAMFRAQSHTGTVVPPESSSGPLFWRHFQTFPTPDSLHPILAYRPACVPQQRRDSSIAVPPVLRGRAHNRLRQRILIDPSHRTVSLRPPPWPQQPAGVPFRQAILPPCPLHRTTSPLRAQKFPGATSCKTCFSSDNSATSRFRRVFSFSSSFSRFA